MKNTRIPGSRFCRVLVVLALVTCNCATMTQPLVRISDAAGEKTDALSAAKDLIEEYEKRVKATSNWLRLLNVGTAVIGAGAGGAATGAENAEGQPTWINEASAVVALVALLVKAFMDEGELKSQREAYTEAVATLNQHVATFTARNRPATPQTNGQRELDLASAICAVEARVAVRLGFEFARDPVAKCDTPVEETGSHRQ